MSISSTLATIICGVMACRQRLSSGAELVKVNISNYNNPSLHTWTRVGDERFDDVKFQIDYNLAQQHFNNRISDE